MVFNVFLFSLKGYSETLSESVGKPEDLWKALKSRLLPNKIFCEVSALKINNTLEHDAN